VARENRAGRLDLPYEPRRKVPRPAYDPDTFGRASERVARYIGSWRFIALMTVVITAWVLWNVLPLTRSLWFDRYPFLLLTLGLSLQASYAAPLILLAQNRQEGRDRVQNEQDRGRDERSIADTEYLVREVAALRIALGEVATRDFVRSELRDLLEEFGRPPPTGPPSERQGGREARRQSQGDAAAGH
jgi:uncharacterized membrane protein